MYDDPYYKGLYTIFTNLNPVSIEDIKLNNEVSELKEFSLEEIKELLKTNPKIFASTFRMVIEEFMKN